MFQWHQWLIAVGHTNWIMALNIEISFRNHVANFPWNNKKLADISAHLPLSTHFTFSWWLCVATSKSKPKLLISCSNLILSTSRTQVHLQPYRDSNEFEINARRRNGSLAFQLCENNDNVEQSTTREKVQKNAHTILRHTIQASFFSTFPLFVWLLYLLFENWSVCASVSMKYSIYIIYMSGQRNVKKQTRIRINITWDEDAFWCAQKLRPHNWLSMLGDDNSRKPKIPTTHNRVKSSSSPFI